MKKNPNILLIMTDQQRPDSLGCYGNDVAVTPHIDRLGAEGVVFENCYVQNPLCCPSRYSILTGRYPRCHGVRSNWYAPRSNERSFGHQLGRIGYNTAMIGKMHLTPWNDNFGFDGRIIAEAKFDVNCPDDYERFLNYHGTGRKEMYDFNSIDYIQQCTAVKSKLPQELHIDGFVGNSVCEYLRNTSEPFCLFASFLSPHNPYDPPEPYDRLFIGKQLPARNIYAGEIEEKPREAYDYINNRLRLPYKTDQLADKQLHLMKAYYYSLNTFIDDWIGRIVGVLKERNLYDNTIIIYTSDHGDLLGDHGLFYKQCFYEQSVKVPLIIHAPAFFKSGRKSDLVEAIDIFNTICGLANAWPGEGAQGKSLVPLLNGVPNYKHRNAVFSENYFGRMVRYKDSKMVYYPGKPYGELYDLGQDPLERNNLWNKPGGSGLKNKLKDLLLEWALADDPMPLPVRKDHFDRAALQMTLIDGRAEICNHQPWYLDHMLQLYADWDFAENAAIRKS